MLVKDNTVVRPTKKAKEGTLDREVYDAIQEIKKKPYYVFKSRKSKQKYVEETGRRRVGLKRATTIPLITQVKGDFGYEEWWYIKDPRTVKIDDGNYVEKKEGLFKNNYLLKESATLYSDKDADLIYFLLNCSATVKKGKIFLYDKEALSKKENKENETMVEAMHLIFGKDTPLNDLAKLRQICNLWDVIGVESMTTSELKKSLWDKVNASHGSKRYTRGYEDFIRDCNDSLESELRSMLGTLIAREIISYNKDYNHYDIKAKGGYNQKLSNIPYEIKEPAARFDSLVESALEDPFMQKLIREVYENNGVERQPIIPEKSSDSELDYYKKLKKDKGFDAIVELCKLHNIKYVTRKHEDIFKELHEKNIK